MARTVDVLASGAVCLGPNVVCDGFADQFDFRIQTHIHEDHMSNFDKSKGFQDILMSPETYALLVAERNAELPYRDNLHQVKFGDGFRLADGSMVALYASNHMLGSCQVELELTNSLRLGYSGDFGWPLNHVIKVDHLVVDSTYGNPNSVRRYTQADAEHCLWELVCGRLRHGPVHIKAHRGTIERVLHILGDNIGVPILASDRLIREVKVYQEHGFAIGELFDVGSQLGQSAMEEKSFVRLYFMGDGFGNEPVPGTTVVCSAAFMSREDHPLLQYTDRAYRIALSNHADFKETLEYVEATGATTVVTDNTRNHGLDLAIAINKRLPNVSAEPSSNSDRPLIVADRSP